ncbi:MAG: hypothetical protein U0802_03755 [Candidatus Binatia bacterium]
MTRGEKRRMRVAAWTLALGGMLALAGCAWLEPEAPEHRGDQAATATDFHVVAVPVYRLVLSPGLLDLPSRLLVVQVRIEGTGDASYTFAPGDLTVALPDGGNARIFDPARVNELLQRTLIAEADMSYLARPGHVPGGIGTFSAGAIASMVERSLLGRGSFGPGQPLQGYVVIDTGQALLSLDGTSFEVVARRQGDDAPARYAYQVAPSATGTGTP